MILDGLQYKLYELQGEKITDYKDGYMIRYADDIVVTARTKEQAEKFKEVIEDFVGERELRLSEKKTKIVNIKEGFDFLSRHYIKLHNQIISLPSEKSIINFKSEIEDLILNPEKHWTQRSLMQSLNSKLYGWGSYHRVEESEQVFKDIDVLVNALLLQLMQKKYPNKTIKKITNKYWYKIPDGRYVFSLPTDRNFRVINLSDIVLAKQKKMDLKKNVFLDVDYFEEKNKENEINKVSGIYKKIWERQNGKCYFCGKAMTKEQEKTIISKTYSKINKMEDMAYVHKICKDDDISYVDTDIVHINNSNVVDIIKNIKNPIKENNINKWKFRELEHYFHETTKSPLLLTFSEIEKIIGFNLCDSAYKYTSYWYKTAKSNISNAWSNQNYEILKLDLQNKKITFRKTITKCSKLNIPEILITNKIPNNAKYELEEFFSYIIKKYGLSKKNKY